MNQYYRTLGLPNTATQVQIKKAYRKLVMQYHPDRNPHPDAKRKFIEVDQAYDYLTSARTRRFYRSKRKYTPPKQKKEEPKSPHQMNDDERRRAFQKAKITKEYLARLKTLELNNGCFYGVVSCVSIFIMPIVGGLIAYSISRSSVFTVFVVIGLPAVCMIGFNKLIYNAALPKKEKLYKAYKKDLSEM